MANLSLLAVLLIGVLCVDGGTHKGNPGKEKRDMNGLNDVLKKLENWKKAEMEKEELLELRQVGYDDDDDDDDESSGEGNEIYFIGHYFDINDIMYNNSIRK